jgi:hypothetical protein
MGKIIKNEKVQNVQKKQVGISWIESVSLEIYLKQKPGKIYIILLLFHHFSCF